MFFENAGYKEAATEILRFRAAASLARILSMNIRKAEVWIILCF